MAGLVIIGMDFGMALTKFAVAIQPPNQSSMERVVVAFRDGMDRQRFHLRTGVWTNADSLSIDEFELTDPNSFHLGLKHQLLTAWSDVDAELVPDAYVTECAFFAVASALARARRAVVAHLDRQYPGAVWNWVVNAATPSDHGAREISEVREAQMNALVARALAYVERHPDFAGALPIRLLRSVVEEAARLVAAGDAAKRVTILRESMAAALFALQSDDAERGTWLTVDVGALTVDTSLFFFSPQEEFRVAAYYAMASRVGGMQAVALKLAAHAQQPEHLAHELLESVDQDTVEATAEFKQLTKTVRDAVADTMKQAWQADNAYRHLFEELPEGRRCRFSLLLVGGGSASPVVQSYLRQWRWHAFSHLPPTVNVARIPQTFGVLWANGVVDHTIHPRPVDHPILAIACGLAQQPWEMPSFDNLGAGELGGRVPMVGMQLQPNEYWWGGN